MVIYWITHKLVENILRQYDGIIVMHKGQIAEYGTFDELMEMKAKFYSLFLLNHKVIFDYLFKSSYMPV